MACPRACPQGHDCSCGPAAKAKETFFLKNLKFSSLILDQEIVIFYLEISLLHMQFKIGILPKCYLICLIN